MSIFVFAVGGIDGRDAQILDEEVEGHAENDGSAEEGDVAARRGIKWMQSICDCCKTYESQITLRHHVRLVAWMYLREESPLKKRHVRM